MQENELKLSGFVNNQQKYIGNTEEGCLEKIYKLLDALDIKFDPNPNKIRQEDIYFDAAQRQIEKLGGSLRIRNIGSQQYLTVKKPLYNRSKTLRREEIESQISETESQQELLTSAFHTHFPECGDEHLEEILRVYNTRHEIKINTPLHAYKLCFDRYEFYCSSVAEGGDPQYEIEIEQIDGDDIEEDPSISKLSILLTDVMGFSFDSNSKYKKGIAWLKNRNAFENRLFVLFDFVSYSKKASTVQNQLIRIFMKLVQPVISQYDAECVKIPSGDGIILGFKTDINIMCFLNDFFSQVRINNNSASKDRSIVIRTAMHYGPVYEYIDINGNPNFAGNGINIVARIGSQTDSNRVLISKECADFLLESERISSQNLSTVYSIKVKHDVVINVMNYYDKDNKIGRPKL